MRANKFKVRDYPREWRSWTCMRSRCLNTRRREYPLYGGRGITVCDRWNTFSNFVEDMGERPIGHSLDRIDNDGNYEPSNCRWALQTEQMNNMRRNYRVVFKGESMTIAEISRSTGLPYSQVRQCIQGDPDNFEERINEAARTGEIRSKERVLSFTGKLIRIDGQVKTQKEWVEHLGHNYLTIKSWAFRRSTTVEKIVRSLHAEIRHV